MKANSWRIMWSICCFDLPSITSKEKRAYSLYRKMLLRDGFQMHQFSVYMRHYASYARAKAHAERLSGLVPNKGKVSFFFFTDKQYGMTLNYHGAWEQITMPSKPEQLLLF